MLHMSTYFQSGYGRAHKPASVFTPPHSYFFSFLQLSIIFTCWMWWSIFVHKTIFWRHLDSWSIVPCVLLKINVCLRCLLYTIWQSGFTTSLGPNPTENITPPPSWHLNLWGWFPLDWPSHSLCSLFACLIEGRMAFVGETNVHFTRFSLWI